MGQLILKYQLDRNPVELHGTRSWENGGGGYTLELFLMRDRHPWKFDWDIFGLECHPLNPFIKISLSHKKINYRESP